MLLVILCALMVIALGAIIVAVAKINKPTPPTQEQIEALTKEAEEFLLQKTINRARALCRDAKLNGNLHVQAIIASSDYETWKASGTGKELYDTAVWLRDKYICRDLDNGKPFFLFDYYELEDLEKNFEAYSNPANREQLDALYKQVYDSFNINE